jgi:antitoxin MazE
LRSRLATGARGGYTLVRTEPAMRKKLSAIGNSLGIVIEKPILELLDFTRDTELDMTTDGERLILTPVRKTRKQRVKAAVDEVLADHASTFRKLAR